MDVIDFPERTTVYAKDQVEYRPLQPQLLSVEKPDMARRITVVPGPKEPPRPKMREVG